jgi:hypothetical protein
MTIIYDCSNMSSKGKRIRLIHTDDQYAKLKNGDMGTITEFSLLPEGNRQILINWDNGSQLAMIEDIDEYQILES